MFNHVFLGCNDIETSRKFYDATMGALGFEGHPLPHGTVYPSEAGSLIVAKPANGEAATVSNGHTLGLKAPNYATVNAWHEAGRGCVLCLRIIPRPVRPREVGGIVRAADAKSYSLRCR